MKKVALFFVLFACLFGGLFTARYKALELFITKSLGFDVKYGHVQLKNCGFFIQDILLTQGSNRLKANTGFVQFRFDVSKRKLIVHVNLDDVKLHILDWKMKDSHYLIPKIHLSNTHLSWKNSLPFHFNTMRFDFEKKKLAASLSNDQGTIEVSWNETKLWFKAHCMDLEADGLANAFGVDRFEGRFTGEVNGEFDQDNFLLSTCNLMARELCFKKGAIALGSKAIRLNISNQSPVAWDKIFFSFRHFQGHITGNETEFIYQDRLHYKKGAWGIDFGNINPILSASFENWSGSPFSIGLQGFVKPVGISGWLFSLQCSENNQDPYRVQLHYFPKERGMNIHAFVKVKESAVGETIWQLGRFIDLRWKHYFFSHAGFSTALDASLVDNQLESLNLSQCKILNCKIFDQDREIFFMSNQLKANCEYLQDAPLTSSIKIQSGQFFSVEKGCELIPPFDGKISITDGYVDTIYLSMDDPGCTAHLDFDGKGQTGVFSCRGSGEKIFALHDGLKKSFEDSELFAQASIFFDHKIHVHGNLDIESKQKSNGSIEWHLTLPNQIHSIKDLRLFSGSLKIRNISIHRCASAFINNQDMEFAGTANGNFRFTSDSMYCSYHLQNPSIRWGKLALLDRNETSGLCTFRANNWNGSFTFSTIQGIFDGNVCFEIPKLQLRLKDRQIQCDAMAEIFGSPCHLTGDLQLSPFRYRLHLSETNSNPHLFCNRYFRWNEALFFGNEKVTIGHGLHGTWGNDHFGFLGSYDWEKQLLGLKRVWMTGIHGNKQLRVSIEDGKYFVRNQKGFVRVAGSPIQFEKQQGRIYFGSDKTNSYLSIDKRYVYLESKLKSYPCSCLLIFGKDLLFSGSYYQGSWRRFLGKIEDLNKLNGWLVSKRKDELVMDMKFQGTKNGLALSKLSVRSFFPFCFLDATGDIGFHTERLDLKGRAEIASEHFFSLSSSPYQFEGQIHYFFREQGFLIQGKIHQPSRLSGFLTWHEKAMTIRRVQYQHHLGSFYVPKIVVYPDQSIYIPQLDIQKVGLFPYGSLRPLEIDHIELLELKGNLETGFLGSGRMWLSLYQKKLLPVFVDLKRNQLTIKKAMGCEINGWITLPGKIQIQMDNAVYEGTIFHPKCKNKAEGIDPFSVSSDLSLLQ